MSDINWDDTDCLFALHNKKRDAIEFFEFKPSTSNCEEFWMVTDSEMLYLKEAWLLIERPAKPIYTQAMSYAGELPSVDMECLYKERGGVNWRKCRVVAILRDMIWLDNLDTGSSSLSHKTTFIFKPIDTRTDSEKAIDDFNCKGEGLTWKASILALELVKAGKVRGVTFTGEE